MDSVGLGSPLLYSLWLYSHYGCTYSLWLYLLGSTY